MFQHVLVPLDGSMRAEQALAVAARIARASAGGSLLLVRVVNPPVDASGGFSPVPLMTEEVVESEMQFVTDYLNAVAARPELAGIRIATDVQFGIPARQIIEAAEDHRCDLIVLCSHGRTGLSRLALGSVAHTLVYQSSVPVLILRQDDETVHKDPVRPSRTLVPLDGSELAETALIPALALTRALAAPDMGALHLMQVVKASPDVRKGVQASAQSEAAYQQAKTYLAAVTKRIQETQKDGTPVVTASVEAAPDVARTLLAAAEQEGSEACDLVAISTHGRGAPERWVMGSVTERLLDTTRLSMLIVPPQRKK